jgi:hypothetical protein
MHLSSSLCPERAHLTVATVLVLTIGVFLAGCTTYKPPTKRDFVKERTYTKSFDAVWTSLVDWFATNNIPIKNIDKASGLISTEYNLRNHITESCDCGKSGFGVTVSNNVIGNFNVLVRNPTDSTVKVNVSAFFKTTVVSSSFNTSVPDQVTTTDCESTGYLEKAILDMAGS